MKPPLLDRVVKALLPEETAEEVLGDLAEQTQPGPFALADHINRWRSALSILVHFLIRTPATMDVGREWRGAFRRLGRQKAFTLIAVSAIGLGLGGTVTMLAVAKTVLWAPLPYPQADRLAVLTNDHTGSDTDAFGVSFANAQEVIARSSTLESVALYLDWQDVSYAGSDGANRIPAAFVSAEYAPLLGLRASLGRFLLMEENRTGDARSVAVLGHGTWERLFGGDVGVIGQSISLNGQPFVIVGVAEDDRGDLRYAWGADPVGIYLPLFAAQTLAGLDLESSRSARMLKGLLRARPELSHDVVQQELTGIAAALAEEFPQSNEGWSFDVQPLDEALYESLRRPAWVLLGISVLVLVLVAINLVALSTLQAADRSSEIAMRLALGAGPIRIARQFLMESAAISALGGAAGLVAGVLAVAALRRQNAVELPEFAVIGVDASGALLVVVAIAVLTLLLGVSPLVGLIRTYRAPTLGGTVRGGVPAGRGRFRNGLVMVEVALVYVLLIGAGLLLESYRTMHATGYGFDTDRLLLSRVELPIDRYEADALRTFANRVVNEARSIGGVDDAFIWSPNRLGQGNQIELLTAEGRWHAYPQERLEASEHALHPGTLESLGIPVLAGRDFHASDDAAAPRVALVSESLAEAVWPTSDAVGKRLEIWADGELVPVSVVGVVADALHRSRLINPFGAQLDVYFPFAQTPWRFLTIALRYSPAASPDQIVDQFRTIVARLEPTAPLYAIDTMTQRLRDEEGATRLTAFMVAAYAALAVALAAIGLYGALAHGVRKQLKEIGIRMAMGATGPSIRRRVVGRGVGIVLLGVACGALVAIGSGRLLAGALYGVTPLSPEVYASVTGLLLAVALGACWTPAARATRVDPTAALRSD